MTEHSTDTSKPEDRTLRRPRKHFTMIRDFALADVVTLANGCSGVGAVLAAQQYLVTTEVFWIWVAVVLSPLAGVFDFLDGRIARWRRKNSALGAQLDSLADLISFGMAPAALGFSLGMRGGWDALVLIYFVCCGLSRLARYNVTAAALADAQGKVKYFEGTPIPTSIAIVLFLAVLVQGGHFGASLPFGAVSVLSMTLHPIVLLYFVSGSAMISKTLKIPKF